MTLGEFISKVENAIGMGINNREAQNYNLVISDGGHGVEELVSLELDAENNQIILD